LEKPIATGTHNSEPLDISNSKRIGERGAGDEEDREDAHTFRLPHRYMVQAHGDSLVEHVAGVEDYDVALATFHAALNAGLTRPSRCGRARE
jgi:hypothetical protein